MSGISPADFSEALKKESVPVPLGIPQYIVSALLDDFASFGGAKLEINPNDGTILNNPAAAKYWKREYRSPYVVPENV